MKTHTIKIILGICLVVIVPVFAVGTAATNGPPEHDRPNRLLPASTVDNSTVGDPQSVDQTVFLEGYEAFSDQDYRDAAPYFFEYMQSNSPDVADYDWAQFFFGISLRELGYSHAAIDILSDLVVRKPNTRIVAYSLELFERITRILPFDHELLVHQVLCDQAYGFVDGDIGDFIQYYQGVYDWENGFHKWGDQHFSTISKGSYYDYKSLYQKALLRVHRNQIDEALAILDEIVAGECKDANLMDDVRKTMARLLYEKGDFAKADQIYVDIEANILDQSQNLLERAWAHYRLGNAERAMGLLYAFEAPRFRNYFTPEYYILKSFIYKDVCHYQKAMSVVHEFRSRYDDSLEAIYSRQKYSEDETLLLLLLNKDKINRTWRFIELLEKEKERLQEFKAEGLRRYLEKLYDLQIAESSAILRQQVTAEYEAYADQMLKYEEEAHLMAYEIGLDMYQRVGQYHYGEKANAIEDEDKEVVIYPFQGEFWNDELADYRVVLPNKCNNVEEWDIFFK